MMLKYFPVDKIMDRVKAIRTADKTIVVAGGVFDILHAGHIRLLNQAKQFGDFLIVCINGDQSANRAKGDPRPIVPLDLRAEMLCSLEVVDYVVAFDEDDPSFILSRIKPDVFVKGGNYTPEALIEYEAVVRGGGRVEIVPLVQGFSTTNVVEDIIRRHQHLSLSSLCKYLEVHDDHTWGHEIWIVNNPDYCSKLLVLENRAPSSLHYHALKKETFKVLQGRVFIGREYSEGEEVAVPRDIRHQFRAIEVPSIIAEASTHHDDSDTYRVDPESFGRS